jgi:hypothetical protein
MDLFAPAAMTYFSPIATVYHYLHMATNNYREYLKQDRVRLKKYFYVLRPLLACRWIEAKGSAPPMAFDELRVGALDDAGINAIIDDLLARKRAGLEVGLAAQIPELNAFIEAEIERFERVAAEFDSASKPDAEVLNEAFVRVLRLEGVGESFHSDAQS